jgi:hypothetical protein
MEPHEPTIEETTRESIDDRAAQESPGSEPAAPGTWPSEGDGSVTESWRGAEVTGRDAGLQGSPTTPRTFRE